MVQKRDKESRTIRAWLLVTNFSMMMAWARVLRILYRKFEAVQDPDQNVCIEQMAPDLYIALYASFLEVFNAVMGMTGSKPVHVMLFSSIRFGVEMVVAPMLPSCSAWQHLLTVACWSFGDTIRFGCFVLDVMVPGGRVAKSVRYTVGPVLFPIGMLGEMSMVLTAAYDGRPWLYVAAALWPLGFYPLMKQLLRQRRKFFSENKKTVKAV
jgi:Protein tyrosine phosphatase-like protein, PTPLA